MKYILASILLVLSGSGIATGIEPPIFELNGSENYSLYEQYENEFKKPYPYPKKYHGFILDINGDGLGEYIIKFELVHCSECWSIRSGLNGEEIAYFNGVVTSSGDTDFENGYPIFEVYSKETNSVKVYIYSRTEYRVVARMGAEEGKPVSNTYGSQHIPFSSLNKALQGDR